MKERKHRLELYSFYDHSGIEKHLEEMAQKGWLLEKIGRFSWVYRRIEPKKMHFAVTCYARASEFDPEPQEGQLVYQDYAERFGWKLLCSSAQMLVFGNEEEDPVPMETEPAAEVEAIDKAARKSFLKSYWFLLAISVLQIVLSVSRFLDDPVETLLSPLQPAGGVTWILLFLVCLVELVGYFRWYGKASQAAENGEFLETGRSYLFHKIVLIFAAAEVLCSLINLLVSGDKMMLAIFLLSAAYAAALLLIFDGTKKLLKKKKASRTTNITVTAIVYGVLAIALLAGIISAVVRASEDGLFDPGRKSDSAGQILYEEDFPLTLEDLQDVSADGYVSSNSRSDSVFLGQRFLWQRPEAAGGADTGEPALYYTVTVVKVPVLYQCCKNSLIRQAETGNGYPVILFESRFKKTAEAPWLADEAWQMYRAGNAKNSYLLCYGKRIVEIELNWKPTAEQMKTVAEKLGGKH